MKKQIMVSTSRSGRLFGFVISRNLFVAGFLLLLCALSFGGWGIYGANQYTRLSLQLALSQQQLNQQHSHDQAQLAELQQQLHSEQQKMAVYARSLGEIEARMARLDALGSRLVDVASLDKNEFDVGLDPAFGGARQQALDVYSAESRLHDTISYLDDHVKQLGSKLTAADYVMQKKQSKQHALPHLWPTSGGWVSSRFGTRLDPFTGQPARHLGVDIANRAGAPILSSGRGIVSFAGKMVDFGYVVDIEHGYGYKTRYAHMASIAVHVGDVVESKQLIGRIGSTGHSTGPHLHYEVRHNGELINPQPFLHRRG